MNRQRGSVAFIVVVLLAVWSTSLVLVHRGVSAYKATVLESLTHRRLMLIAFSSGVWVLPHYEDIPDIPASNNKSDMKISLSSQVPISMGQHLNMKLGRDQDAVWVLIQDPPYEALVRFQIEQTDQKHTSVVAFERL